MSGLIKGSSKPCQEPVLQSIHPAAPSCPGGYWPLPSTALPMRSAAGTRLSRAASAALPGLIQDTQQQAIFSQRKRECKLPVRMTDSCPTLAPLTGLLNCFATLKHPSSSTTSSGSPRDWCANGHGKEGSDFSLCYRIDSACAKLEISSVLPTWTAESNTEGDAVGF